MHVCTYICSHASSGICDEAVLELGDNETCGLFAREQQAVFLGANPWVRTDPNTACTALQNKQDLESRIAVVDRGACTFETKAQVALAAGALALVVVNNVELDPAIFKMDGITSNITAVMVSKAAGDLLKAALGANITIKRPGVHTHNAQPQHPNAPTPTTKNSTYLLDGDQWLL